MDDTVKLVSQERFWRRFRLVGSLITLVFLTLVSVFLASYFRGRRSLTVGIRERSYQLYVPASYEKTQPMPLLLVFHMRAGNGWLMQRVTRLNALASEEGFLVVYPDGYRRSWADGSGHYEADRAGVDDVAFMETLLGKLTEDYNIDRHRVYAAGFSNGGMFALRLACALPERISAVGVVSGVMAEPVLAKCAPEKPLSVAFIHGTVDADLPWEGKPGLASVPESVATWARLNGCQMVPVVQRWDRVQDGTAVRKERYEGCDPGSGVELYAVEGGGHRWPGGSALWQYWLSGKLSEELDAGQLLWRFFAEQPQIQDSR